MLQGFLPRPRLQQFIDHLGDQGYECIGPQLRDGAIVYAPLTSAEDLPVGVRDRQAPGTYRTEAGAGERCFDWAVGPQGLKPMTFAARELLWTCRRSPDGRLEFTAQQPPERRRAVLGVRACDLAALAVHDDHFCAGEKRDPYYQARRDGLLLIAVNCTQPADTCFCACTGDGPAATRGFDLALTELDEGYLLESGSEAGAALCQALDLEPATDARQENAAAALSAAAAAQSRRLPEGELRERLFANLDHPRWQSVAARCLACGNCTLVCPTCFCHAEFETPELDGSCSEHGRDWDSCFTQSHSYFAHVVVRDATALRYRQWLTHKLGSWHDQFGRSGCVGCGRCITWCPVGIDITEEAEAICGERS